MLDMLFRVTALYLIIYILRFNKSKYAFSKDERLIMDLI